MSADDVEDERFARAPRELKLLAEREDLKLECGSVPFGEIKTKLAESIGLWEPSGERLEPAFDLGFRRS